MTCLRDGCRRPAEPGRVCCARHGGAEPIPGYSEGAPPATPRRKKTRPAEGTSPLL